MMIIKRLILCSLFGILIPVALNCAGREYAIEQLSSKTLRLINCSKDKIFSFWGGAIVGPKDSKILKFSIPVTADEISVVQVTEPKICCSYSAAGDVAFITLANPTTDRDMLLLCNGVATGHLAGPIFVVQITHRFSSESPPCFSFDLCEKRPLIHYEPRAQYRRFF